MGRQQLSIKWLPLRATMNATSWLVTMAINNRMEPWMADPDKLSIKALLQQHPMAVVKTMLSVLYSSRIAMRSTSE